MPIKYADKIFASQWLSNEEILIGTKCNHLGVVNLNTHKIYDIPLLEGSTRYFAVLKQFLLEIRLWRSLAVVVFMLFKKMRRVRLWPPVVRT